MCWTSERNRSVQNYHAARCNAENSEPLFGDKFRAWDGDLIDRSGQGEPCGPSILQPIGSGSISIQMLVSAAVAWHGKETGA